MENESGVKKELTGRERQLAALRANEKATQFGGERANPQSQDIPDGNKPWSVRSCINNFAKLELEQDDIENCTENELIRKIIPTKKVTLIQRGSALKVARYAQKGDGENFIAEQIDGKVPQTNINHQINEYQKMTDEQLNEILERSRARRAALAADGSGIRGNTDAESDSETPII